MKHRIFIALDICDPVKQQIIDLIKRLDKLNFPINWETPEKLHITLNFLGKISDEQLYPVLDAVRGLSRTIRPFSLRPMFLETLYKRHEPSIAYLSLGGDLNILKDLRKELCTILGNLDIPQPIRFLPHITLGRLERTDPVSTKTFLDKIRELEVPQFSDFVIGKISFYESLVSKSGSHYQMVRQMVLE